MISSATARLIHFMMALNVVWVMDVLLPLQASSVAYLAALSASTHRIDAGAPRGEIAQVLQRDRRDLLQRLHGEEALVAGHQHVGEGHQALEGLVVDDLAGKVLEEQRAFLLVDVDGQMTQPPRFQR